MFLKGLPKSIWLILAWFSCSKDFSSIVIARFLAIAFATLASAAANAQGAIEVDPHSVG